MVKFTAVPSGTGLRKWSAKRAVNTVVFPSIPQNSGFSLLALKEKLSCAGIPVVTVNAFDWVESVLSASPVDAVTLTGVLTVPELTLVATCPLASEIAVAEAGVSVIPPTLVLNPKVTVFPLSGFPPVSTTLKITCEVDIPPVPCNEMLLGVADTNWIEPTTGSATNKSVGADGTPAAVAVIVSFPAQPLSRYEPCATPDESVTPEVNTAAPLPAQPEEKVTDWGVVMATGGVPVETVTLMPIVPNADSGLVAVVPSALEPRTGAVTLTLETPTAKPNEPVTAVVPTWALAVMVVAPEAKPTAFSVTVATPAASVRAVPAAGVIVARVASVVKVTTELGTIAPLASFNVAFTLPDRELEMVFMVLGGVAVSLSESVRVGVGVVVVVPVSVLVVPVPDVVLDALVGVSDPPLQPARTPTIAAKRSDAEKLEIFWMKEL